MKNSNKMVSFQHKFLLKENASPNLIRGFKLYVKRNALISLAKQKKKRSKYMFRLYKLFLNWYANGKHEQMRSFFENLHCADRKEFFKQFGARMFEVTMIRIDCTPLEFILKNISLDEAYNILSKDNFKLIRKIATLRKYNEARKDISNSLAVRMKNAWSRRLNLFVSVEHKYNFDLLNKAGIQQLFTLTMKAKLMTARKLFKSIAIVRDTEQHNVK